MKLDQVNWQKLRVALQQESPRLGAAYGSAAVANAWSLSALYCTDFTSGMRAIARALQTEPFNPLHSLREVLQHMRFGQWGQALQGLDALAPQFPQAPLLEYLRAMVYLRQEEVKRAATKAREVTTQHRTFEPAYFLLAEAELQLFSKKLHKLLARLPRGPQCVSMWVDLLAKVLLHNPVEGPKLVEDWVSKASVPRNSPEAAQLRKLMELASMGSNQSRMDSVPPDSRIEEIHLLLLHDQNSSEGGGPDFLRQARKLYESNAQRQAWRRWYVSLLTQQAVRESGRKEFLRGLRLVETCLRLEPSETMHYQNRAALFTLMRESNAYHEAWEALDRHQYRLALLGRCDSSSALAMAKTHRLFAQQARFPSASKVGAPGIFAEEADKEGDPRIKVNAPAIAADPELLRQWIYHRQAELAFLHWALTGKAAQFLLHPADPQVAKARLKGLRQSSQALAVLVAGEGGLLAQRFQREWQRRASRMAVAYQPASKSEEVQKLQIEHTTTFADLALLCLAWKPPATGSAVVEELLEFLDTETPFFDEAELEALLKQHDLASFPLRVLANFARDTIKQETAETLVLTSEQRVKVASRLKSELLVRLAIEVYKGPEGMSANTQLESSLRYVERAREACPDDLQTECFFAELLALGDYYTEAKAAVERCCRLVEPTDHQIQSRLEKLRHILESKQGKEIGRRRQSSAVQPHPGGPEESSLEELEQEVQRFPSAVRTYENLARYLGRRGRFNEALTWTERAVAHCLERESQVCARALDMEIQGLRQLAQKDSPAAELFLKGAHAPTLAALQALVEQNSPPYCLFYLLGLCLMKDHRLQEAADWFAKALAACDRYLHKTVLRKLIADLDRPATDLAIRSINEALAERQFESAFKEATATLGQLQQPERFILELARIYLASATAQMDGEAGRLPTLTVTLCKPLGVRLAEACAKPSDLECAEALVRLSMEVAPTRRPAAEAILSQLDAVKQHRAVAGALAEAGKWSRQGDWTQALAAVDGAGAATLKEPHLLRQRALFLLKLGRFGEADATVGVLRTLDHAVAREFTALYPTLVFRQRMTANGRLLREGNWAEALALLRQAFPTSPAGHDDHTHALACCLVLEANQALKDGGLAEARRLFLEALSLIDKRLALGSNDGSKPLLTLYQQIDKELEKLNLAQA